MVIIIKNKIVYVRRARYSRAGWRDCRRNGACNKEATKIWTKAKEEEPLDGGGGGPLFYFLLYTHIYIYVFSFPRRANLDDPQVFFFSSSPCVVFLPAFQGTFFLCVCSLRFPLIQTRTVWCLHHHPPLRLFLSSPPSFFFLSSPLSNLPTGFFGYNLSISDV